MKEKLIKNYNAKLLVLFNRVLELDSFEKATISNNVKYYINGVLHYPVNFKNNTVHFKDSTDDNIEEVQMDEVSPMYINALCGYFGIPFNIDEFMSVLTVISEDKEQAKYSSGEEPQFRMNNTDYKLLEYNLLTQHAIISDLDGNKMQVKNNYNGTSMNFNELFMPILKQL